MWIAYLFMSVASLALFFFGMHRDKHVLWISFTFAASCVAAKCGVMSLSVMEEARRAIATYQNDLFATIVLCLLFAGLSDRLAPEQMR